MIVPSDADFSFQTPKVFSAQGRIGRLRWIARCGAAFALFLAVYGAMSFATGRLLPKSQMGYLALVPALAFFWYFTLATIQRCHDAGQSGWFSALAWLVVFVPTLVSIVLTHFYILTSVYWTLAIQALSWMGLSAWALVPGENDANAYGRPPIKNTTGIVVLASFLLIFLIFALAMMTVGYWNHRVTGPSPYEDKREVQREWQRDREQLRRAPEKKTNP